MSRRPLVFALAFALSTLTAAPAVLAHDDHEESAEHGKDRSRVMGGLHAEEGETVGDYDTVNGGISIDERAHAGTLSTVNGGIDVDDYATIRDATTVNGGIEVGQHVTVDGDLTTVNGGISVDFLSKVAGDVATVNGGIIVRQSDVTGRVRLVNGDITIGAKSHIHGGILVEKNNGVQWSWGNRKPKVPRIIIGPNAIVDGELRFERDVELYVHTTAKVGRIIGAKPQAYTDTIPERE
jgi:DUF4097 and DUF4098 domain-containing protein YvlB